MNIVVGGLIRDRMDPLEIYLRHLSLIDPGDHQIAWVFVLDNCSDAAAWMVGNAFPTSTRIVVADGGAAYDRKRSKPYWRMAMLRNLLADAVITGGSDGLVSVDSDIVATPDLLAVLTAPGRPWVAAIVDNDYGRGRFHNLLVERPGMEGHYARPKVDRARGGPADVVGAACWYRRDLLDAVRFRDDPRGEDVGFARNAKAAGFGGWYVPHEVPHLMNDALVGQHHASCAVCSRVPLRCVPAV